MCAGRGSYGIPGRQCEFCAIHKIGEAYAASEREELACRLYRERVAERGPAWELLGEVTKALWRERAEAAIIAGEDLA